jgi:hypothetical protein
MSGGIFLLDGEELVEMREQPYDSEDLLQTLLAKYPNLLAGGDQLAGSPRRWLLVRREAGVPNREAGGSHWSLDHLFIDQEAVPTLVEVKRSTNTQIRREVVGQMLDYAANGVVYWPGERLRSDFEARCAKEGKDAKEVFQESLGDSLEPERFWGDVEQNLRSGRIRLVFVSDVLPPELRRVIEFLNERMSPTEVVGLEVRRYVGDGGLTTLVPRVVGQTEQSRIHKAGGSREFVDVDLEYYAEKVSQEKYAIAKAIYDQLEQAVSDRGLPWTPLFKRGYFGFYRPGDYYVVGAELRSKNQAMQFRIKLPLAPEELQALGHEIENPYPQLTDHWDARNRQWNWEIPSLDAVPNLGAAVDLTSRYQPVSGHMPTPSAESSARLDPIGR